MIIRLRCRQCGWEIEIPRLRIPRYGARIRCPECGGLQTVPPQPTALMTPERDRTSEALAAAAGKLVDEAVGSRGSRAGRHAGNAVPRDGASAASVDASPAAAASAEETPVIKGEARQLLQRWLRELQRDHEAPLTGRHIFREHADELAHLFSMWQASYPGEEATSLFREELMTSLEAPPVNPDPLRAARGDSKAIADGPAGGEVASER